MLGRVAYRNELKQSDVTGIALPYNYRRGLVTTRVDANDITIAAGAARSAGNTLDIKVTSSITKQFDADWAAGTNAGGFPESALTQTVNTWYHLFILGQTNNSTAFDAGFDSSITAANLLADGAVSAAGFDSYRRVASVLTDTSTATTILDYTQAGSHFIWKAPHWVDSGLSNDTAAAITLPGIPTGVSVVAHMNFLFGEGVGETLTAGMLYSPQANDETANVSGTPPYAQFGGLTDDYFSNQARIRTNTSAQIRGFVDIVSGTIDDDEISVTGWDDDLGDFD